MDRKYNKFWKDKDIIILTTKHLNERDFYSAMMHIGSVMFGITDEEILSTWLDEVKDGSRKD